MLFNKTFTYGGPKHLSNCIIISKKFNLPYKLIFFLGETCLGAIRIIIDNLWGGGLFPLTFLNSDFRVSGSKKVLFESKVVF